MRFTIASVSLVASLVLLASDWATAQWPQWRGPVANAVAPAGDYPVEFSPTKNVMWQIDLGGEGSSSPVVWGETIYVTLIIDNKEVAAAYDLQGRQRWQKTMGEARQAKHKSGSGCNPTPVTDGKHVVVYFKSGRLTCFDTLGNQRWQINLQEKYGEDTLWWDLGTSPVLTSAGVCVAVMQTGDSYLVTFDLDTGKEIWRQPRQYECARESDQSYATPTVTSVDGIETIIAWGADHLTGHDAKTGKLIWECGGFNPQSKPTWPAIASPVVVGDLAIVLYGRAEFMAAIRLGGQGDTTEKNRVWKKTKLGADVPSPLLHQGKVYLLGDKGEVTCLEAETGNQLWQGRLPRSRFKYYSSPMLAGNHLYCLREDGLLFVVSIENEFKLLAENDLEDRAVSTPVPLNGSLIIRTQSKLFRFQTDSSGEAKESRVPATNILSTSYHRQRHHGALAVATLNRAIESGTAKHR